MTESGGGAVDLVREWQSVLQSMAATIGASARDSEIGRHMLAPLQHQAELVQQVLEREQALQADLVRRAFGPVDAVFDMLQQSGAALASQAEAMEEASRALQRAAGIIRQQAELFEQTVRTARAPAEAVKSLASVERAAEPSRPGRTRRTT